MKYLLTCIFLLAATSFLAAQTFHIQGNIELDKGIACADPTSGRHGYSGTDKV